MIKDAHIHNRSFRRTSQIRDNLETVAAEKALEIAISSKLAIASFLSFTTWVGKPVSATCASLPRFHQDV
jgi:hypothetical protein